MTERRFSRRGFAAVTLASAALAGRAALAADPPTPAESPLGPFYPIHRPDEADFDLTWLKGHSQRAAGTVIEVT